MIVPITINNKSRAEQEPRLAHGVNTLFFYKNAGFTKKIKNMLRTYPRLRVGEVFILPICFNSFVK